MLQPNASNSETAATASLQPMGFTDILDTIFSLYRNHFRLFLNICAVYFVFNFGISLIFGLLGFVFYSTSGSSMVVAAMMVIATLVLGLLTTFVATLFTIGGLIFASAQTYLGRHITARTAFRQVKHRFWPFLGCNLLWLLVVGVLTITIVGIPVAIYFGTRWVFWSLAVLVEEHSTINALRRSRELVKGTWWRVFGITLAILLLAFMIQLILVFSLLFVLGLTQPIGGDGDLAEMFRRMFLPELTTLGGLVAFVIRNFISDGITSLMLPIGVIGSTLLYFDQRIRKEGFDIEMRVTNAAV